MTFQKNVGFNVDYNKVSVINRKGKIKTIPRNKKSYIAKQDRTNFVK